MSTFQDQIITAHDDVMSSQDKLIDIKVFNQNFYCTYKSMYDRSATRCADTCIKRRYLHGIFKKTIHFISTFTSYILNYFIVRLSGAINCQLSDIRAMMHLILEIQKDLLLRASKYPIDHDCNFQLQEYDNIMEHLKTGFKVADLDREPLLFRIPSYTKIKLLLLVQRFADLDVVSKNAKGYRESLEDLQISSQEVLELLFSHTRIVYNFFPYCLIDIEDKENIMHYVNHHSIPSIYKQFKSKR